MYAPSFANLAINLSNSLAFRPPSRGDVLVQLVYNGLYRYNENLEAVPDLAAEPCQVAADLITITCKIVETTFHDGTPLTADDVAFTYDVVRHAPQCGLGLDACLLELDSVEAVDAHTVQFRLRSPNATFLTMGLPGVMIDSRALVEAGYKPLADRAPSLDQQRFSDVAERVIANTRTDPPDCESAIAEAEQLWLSTGLPLMPRETFAEVDGSFNACLYADTLGTRLAGIAASLTTTGVEAIALAYPALAFNSNPMGTGPFKFAGMENGNRLRFDAFDGYHFGKPAAAGIDVKLIHDRVELEQAVTSGEADWTPLTPDVYSQVKDKPAIQILDYAAPAYYLLAYNLRQGELFADHALRSAVELCIDKPATVEAATGGDGEVIYSPIDPISWAFQPDLKHPVRDVDAAKGLIESSGWTMGSDGIYEKDGRRLATDVYVSQDDEQRTKFVDLVADQVRDCGMHFNVIKADGGSVVGPLLEYPHIAPGSDKPYEALFFLFGHPLDPDDQTWLTSQITSEEQPDAFNFMGYSNPEVDRLLSAGIATYDQRERARIYRELQQILADDQPVLFAWGARSHEALDSRLRMTDGPINPASSMWWWELEKLTLGP